MKKVAITVSLVVAAMMLVGSTASATGLLIPTKQGVGPLSIKYHRAEVKIKDRVAVTHVDQVFLNHTNRVLEATYIFPLPKGATVSDFYLYMNGKKTKGEILEKNRARNIYEGIVRRMKDPGLLEYIGRDLFQCRVYPVPRKGEMRIEIEFTQVMPYEGGITKYSYPMRTDRASARTMKDFTMSVNIKSKTAIKTIYSPTHKIYHRKKNDHNATAGFETMAATLDRDFELFYTVSDKDVGLNLLTYRDKGEPGFFMLMASPKSDFREKEIIGKRITFVVDTSGSMAGAKMRHTKKAIKYCLNKLNPDDLFNVIRFSTDVEGFMKKPVSASKANIQKALNFVDRIEAAGGTAIDEALTVALAGHVKQSEPNMVVFMTDGHPTVGETAPQRIIKNAAKANKVSAKIFVFGVGNEINTKLLDKVSGGNNGDSTYVKPNAEIEHTVSNFYDKVSHPVMSDLRLDFGSIHEYDVLPKRIPDLFKGGQIIVLGRYRNQGHSALTLTGKMGQGNKKFVFEGRFPKKNKDNNFIPRLWATRKIGFLLDNIRLGGKKKELVDEVIRLSKRYGIVTPYTSYLVTEDTPQVALRQPRPDRRRPPMKMPAPTTTRPGWGQIGNRGVGGSGGSDGSPSEATVASGKSGGRSKLKAMSRVQVFAEKKAEAMDLESGEQAVRMADAVKDLKQANEPRDEADDASGMRYVSGRPFSYKGGAWTDLRYKSGMKVLKIKYMSSAYFRLIAKSSFLKQVFTLGQRVIVVVGKNKAVEIHPDGKETINDKQAREFTP
ncbi:MAG: VWA domain-containing protein [Deltaproteobacteria bacterium]|nr:VWA domain-containing protein [Deltaproteobacteria bacterium]